MLTRGNTTLHLVIAASYGGRQDIALAARALAEDVAAGKLRPEQIDETSIGARMALSDLPAPDLFIRTGGDHRISNSCCGSWLHRIVVHTETLWPELDAATLRARWTITQRERRFGMTGAQIAQTRQMTHDPERACWLR